MPWQQMRRPLRVPICVIPRFSPGRDTAACQSPADSPDPATSYAVVGTTLQIVGEPRQCTKTHPYPRHQEARHVHNDFLPLSLADLVAVKGKQHIAWSAGDYGVVDTTLQIVGESLCEALDLRAGEQVLDVAAGNGNATLSAAPR